jgi:hypothetical protein
VSVPSIRSVSIINIFSIFKTTAII